MEKIHNCNKRTKHFLNGENILRMIPYIRSFLGWLWYFIWEGIYTLPSKEPSFKV